MRLNRPTPRGGSCSFGECAGSRGGRYPSTRLDSGRVDLFHPSGRGPPFPNPAALSPEVGRESQEYAKKQHHEQARQKHRHEQREHAREVAKKKPSMMASWILAIGLALVVVIVVATAIFWASEPRF